MNSITAIILSHYKERQDNLKRIVDDLLAGTVKPEEIIIFIDNPEITFEDERVTIIRSSKTFLPMIRFALGLAAKSQYCFFIDDDLTVSPKTLERFSSYAKDQIILGFEGSILGEGEHPYSNDTSVRHVIEPTLVDIIIRTYFVPRPWLAYGLQLQADLSFLPQKSLDDVYLSLGYKYFGDGINLVIPSDEESNIIELPDGGVGQSLSPLHYANRNVVCRFLMNLYD